MNLVRLFVIGLLFLTSNSIVLAQSYPNKPIKLVIGFPPGAAELKFLRRSVSHRRGVRVAPRVAGA
jgi:hypothetical protein